MRIAKNDGAPNKLFINKNTPRWRMRASGWRHFGYCDLWVSDFRPNYKEILPTIGV